MPRSPRKTAAKKDAAAAPPSTADVKAAAKAADEAEAERKDSTFRLDRGESLPPQAPPPTATDKKK